MKGFTSALLASLAAVASATSVALDKRASPLSVKLERVSNSVVSLAVTNTGAKDLRLLNRGTIFDSLHTEKLQVFTKESQVEFEGVRIRPYLEDIQDESLTTLKAGQTISKNIDAASVHDLTNGGTFTFIASGIIPQAEAGSNKLAKSIAFESNTLSFEVDGAEAAQVTRVFPRNSIQKRSRLSSDCTGSKRTATLNALSNCVTLANNAATQARSGSATKFNEYFKTTSSSTRSTVASRLSAVARECGSSTSGATQYHCTDIYGYCSSNVLAYTLPSTNEVVNCGIYFTALPNLTRSCHAQDQTTTTLHEFTHAPGVYSPGTQDYGYGYQAATALSSARAVLNADSYALYANAIYAGC